jgi:hypothetical protein
MEEAFIQTPSTRQDVEEAYEREKDTPVNIQNSPAALRSQILKKTSP